MNRLDVQHALHALPDDETQPGPSQAPTPTSSERGRALRAGPELRQGTGRHLQQKRVSLKRAAGLRGISTQLGSQGVGTEPEPEPEPELGPEAALP